MLRNILVAIIFTIVNGCCTKTTQPYLKLPALVGNNMVLQQNTEVNIWGWTNPNQRVNVRVEWNDSNYTTKADELGNWKLQIKTVGAGGPFQIYISADTSITLNNILLGEVWLSSGQSNMEFPLSAAENGEKYVQEANTPNIRIFNVEKALSTVTNDTLRGSWKLCSPDNIASFSAVSYFFGKHLNENLNVPIGLINSAWGGTPVEGWMSSAALQSFPYFQEELEILSDTLKSKNLAAVLTKEDSIKQIIKHLIDFNNKNNIGKHEQWYSAAYDDSDWNTLSNPVEWSNINNELYYEGVLWLRKNVTIPESWIGKELSIELGAIDEMDETFVNGELIGLNNQIANWNKNRIYQIPASLVIDKNLCIAVRAINTFNEGGFIGKPEQLKLFPTSSSSVEKISLVGEWKYKSASIFPKVPAETHPKTPTLLYNAMIHPIENMTIKGVIWYQGEENVPRAMLYRELFPAMINDWRKNWNLGSIPFYFVQIAPFNYGKKDAGAELRESQFLTMKKVENTGMAVTLDIGNPGDIHPKNKKDVGERLSLWALAKTYNKKISYSGPVYDSISIEGKAIRVFFSNTGKGLVLDKNELSQFEISGADKIFHPAKTQIQSNTLLISSVKVENPLAVRYAWSNTAEATLFNLQGLPASSFATDNWERVTD